MPQYLMIAESVYRKVKDSELFTEDTIENLNHLMTFIRKEIIGTVFKLKYNYIDFDELFSKPLNECNVKIDVSLIPHFNHENEYVYGWRDLLKKLLKADLKLHLQLRSLFLSLLV